MTEATPNAAQAHPADVMFNFIVTLLTPLFLTAAEGDIRFARQAAAETLEAYGVRDLASLLIVAQIVAFGLAALGSLCLSMADEASVNRTLRLRGNANALNRAAELNRKALDRLAALRTTQTDPDQQEREEQAIEAVAAAQQAARTVEIAIDNPHAAPGYKPAPAFAALPKQEQRNRAIWAAAFAGVAEEFTAEMPFLAPAERRVASIKATAMSNNVLAILSGKPMRRPEIGDADRFKSS